ncbi:MAG: tetratricopeptide repeat protein [Tepidisphaeraceae bacterium]|jgi:tetratricopeptide (TPR) repeat protein
MTRSQDKNETGPRLGWRRSQTWWRVFFALGCLIAIASARADSVAIRHPGEPDGVAPTVYSDVKITDIRLGRIEFTTSTGNDVVKDLASVAAISIDDEPQFNQAEEDYAANQFDRAVEGFDQTIEKTDKTWLKAYCQPLLADAANKAGRFDKAVQAYVYLVLNQPGMAAAHRPTVPAAGSGYLDGAAQALSSAADTANLSTQQQAAILSLLLDVQRARNDAAAIDAAASRLGKLVGDSGNPTADVASLALADAKLTEAGSALEQKDYDRAITIITAAGNLFLDPRRQADAMYVLAQAREGQTQGKNDADAWRDVAIAYMRVVADFKDAAGAPHVAQSLLATAGILENHLNQPGKAMQIYQSVRSQFPNSLAADEADRQLARLGAAGVRPD